MKKEGYSRRTWLWKEYHGICNTEADSNVAKALIWTLLSTYTTHSSLPKEIINKIWKDLTVLDSFGMVEISKEDINKIINNILATWNDKTKYFINKDWTLNKKWVEYFNAILNQASNFYQNELRRMITPSFRNKIKSNKSEFNLRDYNDIMKLIWLTIQKDNTESTHKLIACCLLKITFVLASMKQFPEIEKTDAFVEHIIGHLTDINDWIFLKLKSNDEENDEECCFIERLPHMKFVTLHSSKRINWIDPKEIVFSLYARAKSTTSIKLKLINEPTYNEVDSLKDSIWFRAQVNSDEEALLLLQYIYFNMAKHWPNNNIRLDNKWILDEYIFINNPTDFHKEFLFNLFIQNKDFLWTIDLRSKFWEIIFNILDWSQIYELFSSDIWSQFNLLTDKHILDLISTKLTVSEFYSLLSISSNYTHIQFWKNILTIILDDPGLLEVIITKLPACYIWLLFLNIIDDIDYLLSNDKNINILKQVIDINLIYTLKENNTTQIEGLIYQTISHIKKQVIKYLGNEWIKDKEQINKLAQEQINIIFRKNNRLYKLIQDNNKISWILTRNLWLTIKWISWLWQIRKHTQKKKKTLKTNKKWKDIKAVFEYEHDWKAEPIEFQIVLVNNKNESWFSHYGIYHILKLMTALIRLQWFASEASIKRIIYHNIKERFPELQNLWKDIANTIEIIFSYFIRENKIIPIRFGKDQKRAYTTIDRWNALYDTWFYPKWSEAKFKNKVTSTKISKETYEEDE